MTFGEQALMNVQANGLAANALFVSLMNKLIAKGTLSAAEADEVVGNALGELRANQSSMCRTAYQIVEQDIAPEFAKR